MAGINLDLVTDTRDIKKGFKDVESALEDVADSLDDVAKDGENATDDLEKGFKDLARETKKEARDMGRDVSKSYDRMSDDAGEATKQMADDGYSNAREVAASFDGSAESIVDGFQGAAAEMFSGFGPAGAAAGLAAAAGLGLITAELQKQQEEAEEAAQASWDMAQEMVDAGVYAVTEGQKVELLKSWLGDPEAQKEVKSILEETGITAADFGAAMVGLGDKREEVEAKISAHYQEQDEKLQAINGNNQGLIVARERLERQERKALDILDTQEGVMADAVRLADELRDTFKDVGVEVGISERNAELLRRTAERTGQTDATPEIDFTDAFNDLRAFQRGLDGLRAPRLTVQIDRIVR